MSIDINNQEDKTYIVLGSPWSATSFVSKCLEDAGVDMGSSMPKLYQDREFVVMNQHIIKRAGGRWYDPPSEEKILSVDAKERMEKLMKKKGGKLWGFKDPRSSLTIKKYFPYLDGDTYLICCFRKPEKVLERQRDRHKVGKKVIDKYNNSIISAIKEFVAL